MFYQWNDGDLLLNVRVQPRASSDGFAEILGDRVKLRITTPPVDGKANLHLVAYLAKAFRVARGNVCIISGESGRNKLIRIRRPAHLPEIIENTPWKPFKYQYIEHQIRPDYTHWTNKDCCWCLILAPKYEIAYKTDGELDNCRSNAIFICQALSGDQHAAGYHAIEIQSPHCVTLRPCAQNKNIIIPERTVVDHTHTKSILLMQPFPKLFGEIAIYRFCRNGI